MGDPVFNFVWQKKNDQYPWSGYRLRAQIVITGNSRQAVGKRILDYWWLLNCRLQLNLEIYLLPPSTIRERPPPDKAGIDTGVVLVPPSDLAAYARL